MTVDDIANSLSAAQADGQGMYAVADAMGNSGQRMLSAVARNPSDTRQVVYDMLMKRQAGQGRRLTNAMTEGFGSPQTAKQTEAAMEALRSSEGNINYGAAKASAGAVDPTAAIKKADEFISPGISSTFSNSTDIADNSVESAVRKARSYLTDGKSVVSDFNRAFSAKEEIQNLIDNGSKTVKSRLIPIKQELDKALEAASPDYAKARDTFRMQSKALEATNLGREFAKSGRIEDTIPAFNALSDAEKAGFRPGYVDKYIADIQGTLGPMTNRARPLISDATAAEFPAFSLPGKADQLGSRIAREQRMFETANTALGGSKTADNLADAADLGQYDPGMLATLATDGIKGVLVKSIQGVADRARGMSPRVIDHVGKSLMETNPQAAKDILSGGLARLSKADKTRAVLLNALIGGNVTTPSRITNPR